MTEVARASQRLEAAVVRLEAGFARLETAVARKFDRDEAEIDRLSAELQRVEGIKAQQEQLNLAAADQIDHSIGRLNDLLSR